MSVGQLIKEKRKALGLTLEYLGAEVGTSKSYIHEIESGKSMPGLITAARLSRVLRIPMKTLADAALAPSAASTAWR